jgi:DNA replication protein DnaC
VKREAWKDEIRGTRYGIIEHTAGVRYHTSNKSFADWQELFGDPVIATAILDRLLHHSKVVHIKEHSYRLKEHAFNQKGLQPQGNEIVNTLPT